MRFLVVLALALIAFNPVIGQCDYDFCGRSITVPDAVVNPNDPVAEQVACSIIPLGIQLGEITSEQCEGLPTLEYICCPPQAPIPCGNTTIQFCAGGMENPNLIINPEAPEEDWAWCSYVVAGLALGLVDDDECAEVPLFESLCCPGSIGFIGPNATKVPLPPIDNSTLPPTYSPTTEEQIGSCLFCGSDVPYNKEKTWAGDNLCSQFDEVLGELSAGDQCTSFIDGIINENGFDFQSFCECEGKAAPDLCKVCPDDEELDADKAISGVDGLTCGQRAEYVKHLTDSTKCGELDTSACCTKKHGGGGKEGKSSGTSLTISGCASALILVLSFAI